jgi:hypothetical protein
MTVVGLLEDERSGGGQPTAAQINRALDALDRVVADRPSPALLGAATWAFAVAGDARTETMLESVERQFVPRQSSSMELGLLLAGLAAAFDSAVRRRPAIGRLAAAAAEELLRRFSDTAQLFGESSWGLRPNRLMGWRMTSFASQVYPMHGLAEYAYVTHAGVPPQVLRAADRLVEMQGPLGQWWWLYSPLSGGVVEPYPVYSVHQDAMAFMALGPLKKAGLGSFDGQLGTGLEWLFGANDLDTPLVDLENDLIFRCIQRHGADAEGRWGMSRSQRLRVVLRSWSRHPHNGLPAPGDLEILQEVRPYHLGWVLYARALLRKA